MIMPIRKALPVIALLVACTIPVSAQHSVARQWNEALLNAIRGDFARPTVHARNLFHTSVAMYDAWAVYDKEARTYFLGDTLGGFVCPFTSVTPVANIDSAQSVAVSFAAYRLIRHRFANSPGKVQTMAEVDALMDTLGYDKNFASTDYANDGAAALGNYIAQCLIAFGLQDGSNEANAYTNLYYETVNPPIIPVVPGNPTIDDPNRWQEMVLDVFIDQGGNVIPLDTIPFLSPEWGNVIPFSLTDDDLDVYTRDSNNYRVYCDPGDAPYLDTLAQAGMTEEYKWGFELVSIWSSHLDTTDGVMWDISPASIGNISNFPTSFSDYPNFYDLLEGGDIGAGWAVNPSTGLPYPPQMVPRGDYARILAEFWADGPDSETPPGHWFTILNYVNDHVLFEKRWRGKGPILDDLEWDVKAYLALGGAMHDVAIAAWGIKGWYDYIRPVSAIRYLCDQGQSSDTLLPNYSPNGIRLYPGLIELVDSLDPLVGDTFENVWKIKLLAWQGPDSIGDPATEAAGVGWILAEHWWPYQRPTFVTPPFAGYVSGHSTYSRAAAELMTLMTGDAYFPGGVGEFFAPQNQFLVFEEGPSQDVTLQWATYRDASDQCSLSRIWGGIHPPADDIPGRLIGLKIGPQAFAFAEKCMDGLAPEVLSITPNIDCISDTDTGSGMFTLTIVFSEEMDTAVAPTVAFPVEDALAATLTVDTVASGWTDSVTYVSAYGVVNANEKLPDVDVLVSSAQDLVENVQSDVLEVDNFGIDTRNPKVTAVIPSPSTITEDQIGSASFSLAVVFDEPMATTSPVNVGFPVEDPAAQTLTLNTTNWVNDQLFIAQYDVANSHETLLNIDVSVGSAEDVCENDVGSDARADVFSIVMEPSAISDPDMVNLTVYPNPVTAGDQLIVRSDQLLNGVFYLVDAHGRIVVEEGASQMTIVETDQLRSGVYVLRLVNSRSQSSSLIVVK